MISSSSAPLLKNAETTWVEPPARAGPMTYTLRSATVPLAPLTLFVVVRVCPVIASVPEAHDDSAAVPSNAAIVNNATGTERAPRRRLTTRAPPCGRQPSSPTLVEGAAFTGRRTSAAGRGPGRR